MENKFYYGQKVFYATNLSDPIQSFEIKGMSTDKLFIRLSEPDKNVGVNFCPENNTFSLVSWSSYYSKWVESSSSLVAISLDETELLKILAKKIIKEEKQKIESSQKAIAKSWALIVEAQKYL